MEQQNGDILPIVTALQGLSSSYLDTVLTRCVGSDPVYCFLVSKSIAPKHCLSLQDPARCFGCAATSHLCHQCREKPVLFPEIEFCSTCLDAAMAEESGRKGSESEHRCTQCKTREIRYAVYGLCLQCTVAAYRPISNQRPSKEKIPMAEPVLGDEGKARMNFAQKKAMLAAFVGANNRKVSTASRRGFIIDALRWQGIMSQDQNVVSGDWYTVVRSLINKGQIKEVKTDAGFDFSLTDVAQGTGTDAGNSKKRTVRMSPKEKSVLLLEEIKMRGGKIAIKNRAHFLLETLLSRSIIKPDRTTFNQSWYTVLGKLVKQGKIQEIKTETGKELHLPNMPPAATSLPPAKSSDSESELELKDLTNAAEFLRSLEFLVTLKRSPKINDLIQVASLLRACR